MQYHALALAARLADVDLVGHAGSAPYAALQTHPHIRWHALHPSTPVQHGRSHVFFLAYAAFKVLRESLQLFWLLCGRLPSPDVILVQNPPAIPTLLIALVVARIRTARLVVDWHNLSYTVLALRLGPQHLLVRLAAWYECTISHYADAHLCVSRALQAELTQRWGISQAVVLYDRPAECFAPTPGHVRDALFRRLQDVLACPTLLERSQAGERPVILMSPTSWTADEDFSLLLDAMQQWDALLCQRATEARHRPLPPVLLLITGKGPLRAHYETQIAHLVLSHIHIRTLWLSAEDYPVLLGAADLGLCLHRSSSGFDLPMKLADMCGAGLPVCVLDYGPCLLEQVQPGVHGLLFTTSTQLAGQLNGLFQGFPDHTPVLDQLRHNVMQRRSERWGDHWGAIAAPMFAA
jgi:beta-1,4-mannosyltransferase